MTHHFFIRSVVSIVLCAMVGAVHALTVTTTELQGSYCGRPSGWAIASASGGTPPYSYSWSNGSTDFQINGVVAGTYTVTVTDAVFDEATADVVIPAYASYQGLGNSDLPLGSCVGDPPQAAVYTGQDNLIDPYDPTGLYGPPPYSFSHPNLVDYTQSTMCNTATTVVYNVLYFNATPGSYLSVDYTDADGCPGSVGVLIDEPFTPPALQIVGVGPSCQNTASGSMTVAVSDSEGKEFGIYVRRADTPVACYSSDVTGFSFTGIDPSDGLKTFDGLGPGDHYLVWTTDPYGLYVGYPFAQYECRDSILFNVPELLTDCGSLTGRLYLDDDSDCTLDAAENRVPFSIVTVEPGPYYLTTNNIGRYNSALPYGTYSVVEQHPVFEQSCPADLTLSGPGTVTSNTGCAGGQPMDVMVDVASGAARPGFVLRYGIHVRNLTAGSSGVVTLALDMDPVLSFIGSSVAPSSVVGSTVTWTTPQFTLTNVFQERYIWVDVQVPPDVLLIGSQLDATATIATANTDGDPANNTYNTNVTVTGSFDSNDKVAATSSRSSNTAYYLDQDEWIDYTIRFQNTGTDTAFNVLITDTLPQELDPGTVIMGAGSHPYTWGMGLTGTLNIVIADIMLPDSNVNMAGSNGFVLLRVKPRDPLTLGTVISNTANIFFDFNPPVITEPSMLVAELSTSVGHGSTSSPRQFSLLPNPATDQLNVTSNIEIISIRIIAADGREVLRSNLRASSTTVDVNNLTGGAYLLIAELTNGTTLRERFIKN